MMGGAVEQFRDAIRAAGLTPPDSIEDDGKLHRFASNGKRNDDAGWYVLHLDGVPAGCFGDWRTGLKQSWRAEMGRELTPAEEAEYRRKVESAHRQREASEMRKHAEAARRAARIWDAARPAPANHPYLTLKGAPADGLRLHKGLLVIPLRDAAGVLHSLQFIDAEGGKRYLGGGKVSGCYFVIGMMAGVLYIAEGYATAATIHAATGHAVAVAFDAGNLKSVARVLREKHPDIQIVVCADDDRATSGNPGMTKASDAARGVGGLVAIPNFGADIPVGASDFNDLAKYRGHDAVISSVATAKIRASRRCMAGIAAVDGCG